MNVYYSENEQAEQVKEWLKKYGYSIIIGIVLGLAMMYGWQYWKNQQLTVGQKASDLYQQVFDAYQQEKINIVHDNAQTIITDYAKTPYAAVTSLLLANEGVNENDLKKAKTHLSWVIDHSSIMQFRQIARIRLARVLLAENDFQTALSTLEKVDDKSFLGLIAETKGDIYLMMSNKDEAKKYYQQAIAEDPLRTHTRAILSVKLNNLDVLQGDKP